MTASYRWVQWNRHKVVYDAVLASAILMYIVLYVAAGLWAFAPPGDISVPISLRLSPIICKARLNCSGVVLPI